MHLPSAKDRFFRYKPIIGSAAKITLKSIFGQEVT